MIDSFSLLGLPRSYQLNLSALDSAYQAAMVACHPDKHNTDPLLATQAELMSADINKSYAILVEPLQRARHLLELEIGKIEQHITHDSDFLLLQMQWREKLENSKKADIATIYDKLKMQLQAELDTLTSLFADHWQSDEVAQLHIRKAIDRAQYWQKLLAQVSS